MQDAHFVLIDKYFEPKRNEIDDYIDEIWLPKFAENLFKLDHIQLAWTTVVNSSNDLDRPRSLTLVGPEIQKKINRKRSELVKPLKSLEHEGIQK
ncbi:hypothetical protein [Flagellimonas algicola]|uniref:Uncharacterized protein n=1 Tax=Flagellimonas algicola TaxID=2583815 RepID=A0ABY2WFT2_9FLAO|nr:hypothetical protein [Allomuricauda algicola]TMU50404.1 hypothetical protein FGG15_19850 [Allomuricauda algicola]